MINGYTILKFINHDNRIISMARKYGWLPGARYTHLRNVKNINPLGFLDIDWKNYDFQKHLDAVKEKRPFMTVARDIIDKRDLVKIIDEAYILKEYVYYVIIVPKDTYFNNDNINNLIPNDFILGYSVPSLYGKTQINPDYFKRPVHLLGGRPDVQRKLAEKMPVISIDNNRFILDACYGDYFDGTSFKPHKKGGFINCIRDSIININKIWNNYIPPKWKGYEIAARLFTED